MKHIVITGSTRGIGAGLAESFLQRGCQVTISGRRAETVEQAVKSLAEKFDPQAVFGQACDVCNPDEVRQLWEAARQRFARIDIWINNAGFSGQTSPAWELPPIEVEAVVCTNLMGTIYGSQVALQGMLAQGFGALYNMEGMGSDGRKHAGLALYGTTKYAVHYYTECLVNEIGSSPVLVGALRPGMVVTDMLLKREHDNPQEWERARRAINLLAERLEVVAPWLADQILANDKQGVTLRYLTIGKLLRRMLTGLFHKRDLFLDLPPGG